MRVWGDVGIAAFEGGFEFNAIIYIVPKFRFEVDIHVWAGVEVFDIDFASVDIYGLLAGPGRWHIVGRRRSTRRGRCPTSASTSTRPGAKTATRRCASSRWSTSCRRSSKAQDDKGTPVNWSAVLPVADDGFVTLIKLPPAPGLLAHPNALLQFVQKRMPLAKALDQARLGRDRGREADRDRHDLVRPDRQESPTAGSTTTSRSRSSSR